MTGACQGSILLLPEPMMLAAMAISAVLTASPATVERQGRAVVECQVTPKRILTDCRVLSETPAGANVGAFAVKLASGFRIPPNDRRVVDGRVRIPLKFKLP